MNPYIYTGNGAYCYANSLHMSLLAAGASPVDLPGPDFMECLTTMPFGKMYIQTEITRLFFPNGASIDPDSGLSYAIATLGWACDESFGGTDAEARRRLLAALGNGPVLVGPLNMGCLTYTPGYHHASGADHFVIALEVEDSQIRIHDPNGFPNVTISIDDFMAAWKAEGVDYGRRPYNMRTNFHPLNTPNRTEMITLTIDYVRKRLSDAPSLSSTTYGVTALQALAEDLRGEVTSDDEGMLKGFSLPLAARRLNDAAVFLNEADHHTAECLLKQSRLFGQSMYLAVHKEWQMVAGIIEQIAELEAEFERMILQL